MKTEDRFKNHYEAGFRIEGIDEDYNTKKYRWIVQSRNADGDKKVIDTNLSHSEASALREKEAKKDKTIAVIMRRDKAAEAGTPSPKPKKDKKKEEKPVEEPTEEAEI